MTESGFYQDNHELVLFENVEEGVRWIIKHSSKVQSLRLIQFYRPDLDEMVIRFTESFNPFAGHRFLYATITAQFDELMEITEHLLRPGLDGHEIGVVAVGYVLEKHFVVATMLDDDLWEDAYRDYCRDRAEEIRRYREGDRNGS